jgi:lambda family phage portal protein
MTIKRTTRRNPENIIQTIQNDFNAAKDSRFRRNRRLPTSGASAEYHVRNENHRIKMLEEARDMVRNDAVIGQGIRRAAQNIVQGGIMLDVQTGNPAIDNNIKDEFIRYCEDPELCDVAGEMTFHDMEFLATFQTFVDGDIVALLGKTGQIQLIESHRIQSPSSANIGKGAVVVNGVEIDPKTGKRKLYYIAQTDDNGVTNSNKVSDVLPVPARVGNLRQLCHVYDPNRVSQVRGITVLAPIFDTAGMIEDINFAKLVQQQAASAIAFVREREIGFKSIGGGNYGPTEADSDGRIVDSLSPGMEVVGLPGERVTGFSPNIPNAEYFQQVRLCLQIISVNLGLPLCVFLLDASDTNFSGFRGAIDQAKLGFIHVQKNLIAKFHRPVFRWWLEKNATRLKVDPAEIYAAHHWIAPRWPYIQPLQDAQADAYRLEKKLSSPRRICSERGIDFDNLINEIATDRKAVILAAMKAAGEIGGGVTWRDIIYEMDKGGNANAQNSNA